MLQCLVTGTPWTDRAAYVWTNHHTLSALISISHQELSIHPLHLDGTRPQVPLERLPAGLPAGELTAGSVGMRGVTFQKEVHISGKGRLYSAPHFQKGEEWSQVATRVRECGSNTCFFSEVWFGFFFFKIIV